MISFVHRKETDPFFNLAAEEYLVKHYHEPCLMIWQNIPAVVVGKHQNTLREINMDFANTRGVKVVRRISGGGTVYHDLGNLNFTFLNVYPGRAKIDFTTYLQPFVGFLRSLGLNAQQTGVSNISIEGYKCSGNACHLHQNKALYHGTLLFDSCISDLLAAISPQNADDIKDKAIDSVRVKVKNIREQLKEPISLEAFIQSFVDYMASYFEGLKPTSFIEDNRGLIQQLADEKYKSWEWNFAYSPKYYIKKQLQIEGKIILLECLIVKGMIENMSFSPSISSELLAKFHILLGTKYVPEKIDAVLNDIIKSLVFK